MMDGFLIFLLAASTYGASVFSIALAIHPETKRREIEAWGYDDGDSKMFAFILGALWFILPIIPLYYAWPKIQRTVNRLMP